MTLVIMAMATARVISLVAAVDQLGLGHISRMPKRSHCSTSTMTSPWQVRILRNSRQPVAESETTVPNRLRWKISGSPA